MRLDREQTRSDRPQPNPVVVKRCAAIGGGRVGTGQHVYPLAAFKGRIRPQAFRYDDAAQQSVKIFRGYNEFAARIANLNPAAVTHAKVGGIVGMDEQARRAFAAA